MITHISKLDEARNDTLITKAEGQALNRLSLFYGFERPTFIKDEQWRSALSAVVFGARGTLGILLDFLFKVFKEFSDFATYEMSCVLAGTLTYTGDVEPKNLEGRLVRIAGNTYYITNLINTVGQTTSFNVATVETTYFKAFPNSFVGETLDVAVLPYVVEEYGGEVKLLVDAGLFDIPSHFLQDATEDDLGGYILDYFSSTTENRFGDQDLGKKPIYLLDEEFSTRFFDVALNILASGIQLKGATIKWSDEPSIFASITNLIRFGSVDPSTTRATPTRT